MWYLTNRSALVAVLAVCVIACVAREDDEHVFDEEQPATPEQYVRAYEALRKDTLVGCGCRYDPDDIAYLELDGVFAAVEAGALRFDAECAARILASHDGLVCEPPAHQDCWVFKGDKQVGESCGWPSLWFSECGDDMLCMAIEGSDAGVCRKFVEPGGACAEDGSTGGCRLGSCIDGVCTEGTVGVGGECDLYGPYCASGLRCDAGTDFAGTCHVDRCDLVHQL
jgi:hypothetical protein